MIQNWFMQIWHSARWYLQQMVRQFYTYDCMASAGALTYTTLFAVVPMMTVAYAMFSIFPEFEGVGKEIQAYLFANLLPDTSAVLLEKFEEFSDKARQLTWIGFGFLFVTTIMMLVTIEKSFNAIWHVPEPRRGMQRLLVYWAVLSLGPPMIGAGALISAYFFGLPFVSELDAYGLGELLLSHLPKLLTITGFTVLYFAVPNCSVPLKHALMGGVLTMLMLELAKWGFTEVASNLSFVTIYGAFAAVPLFLAWLYIVWVIVLSSAIFVRSLALKKDIEPTEEPLLVKAARVLRLLAQSHREGNAVTETQIADTVRLSGDEHERIFGVLRQMRLVRQSEDESWLLGRSLRAVTLWDLYEHLPEGLTLERLKDIDDLPAVVEPVRALARFGSNEMTLPLDIALTGDHV